MKRRRRPTLLVLLVVASFALAGELAAELVPLGREIQLRHADFPEKPMVAVQPGGDYVVAWAGHCSAGSFYGIFYSPVAAGGVPLSPWHHAPPRITHRSEYMRMVSLTATPAGYDVVWHPCDELTAEDPARVFYRNRLDLHGRQVGRSTRLVNAHWLWHLAGGELLAGWARPRLHAIEAQRVAATGGPAGPVLRLNSHPVNVLDIKVLPLAGGGFLAVWLGDVPRSGGVLRARRFSAAGEPLGPELDVNSLAGGLRWVCCETYTFAAAAAPDGGFAVAWVLDDTLYLRFFDSSAAPLGPEVPIVTRNDVLRPSSMAFDPAGNLLLMWENFDQTDVRIQLFDGTGQSLGPPRRASSQPIDEVQPFTGNVAWGGDSWLVTWNAFIYPFDVGTAYLRRFADRPAASEE